MPRIECAGCGFVLSVSDELRDGAGFTCAHCGLIARNLESARRFRWAELDPFVRRHGVSRGNLWGGLLGSLAWLPILAVVLAVQGRLDAGLFVAIGAPYVFLLAVLKQRRARTPAMLWLTHLWMALGCYLLYLWLLVTFLPDWAGRLLDSTGSGDGGVMPAMLVTLGLTWLATGAFAGWFYRLRARRLPRATGTPPLALIGLLAGLLLAGVSCAGSSHQVFSTRPYAEALAQAQSEGKLLLVDATATWCGPCQKMERTTWPDPQVAAWIAEHAIAVQVDVDAEPALARELRIEAMPTLILFKDGAERARHRGYLDAQGLLEWLGPFGSR